MVEIETDAADVFKKFQSFTTKEMKKALTNAVKDSSRQLVREARQQLRKTLNNTNKKNPKYNDTLESGVRSGKVVETKEGDISVNVKITTKTKDNSSGSFRLHILESGSYKVGKRFATTYNKKKLKKPRYTGILKPTYFFKTASNNFNTTYQQTMNSALSKAVNKINNRKFGK